MQTILPSVCRRLYPAFYQRQRLELSDGDFLDIDWCRDSSTPQKRAVLICHGLEGSSRAPYVKGMARAFRRADWDVGLLNFRSCSGELNRLPRSYHSGETEDLALVLAQAFNDYDEIALIGFSLGGNAVLKYLGEQGTAISDKLSGAVVFSVPCDLAAAGKSLQAPENKFYMKRFLRMLDKKVSEKYQRGDHISSPAAIKAMTSFWQFDDAYTAPLHGFKGADDYYAQSSSRQFLHTISIPTLLVNALNDPFLATQCFPAKEADASKYFYLETPQHGGHCGFPTGMLTGVQWHEQRALAFLNRDSSLNCT